MFSNCNAVGKLSFNRRVFGFTAKIWVVVGARMRQTKTRKLQRDLQAKALVATNFLWPDNRRYDLRHFARQCVAMKFRNSNLLCDLVDLSETGARICVVDGIVPNVDEKLVLTLFDGTDIEGQVSWLKGQHIGVAFGSPVADIEERLDFEDLGSGYFGKAVTLQKATRRS